MRRVMAALLALWPGRNWRFYKFFQMKDSAQCIRQLGSVCIASSAPGERAHQVCAALPELQTWRCRIAKHMGPDLTDSVLQDLLIWQKFDQKSSKHSRESGRPGGNLLDCCCSAMTAHSSSPELLICMNAPFPLVTASAARGARFCGEGRLAGVRGLQGQPAHLPQQQGEPPPPPPLPSRLPSGMAQGPHEFGEAAPAHGAFLLLPVQVQSPVK